MHRIKNLALKSKICKMDRLNPFYILVIFWIIFMQRCITEGYYQKMEECSCPLDIYDPICASNDVTYTYSCYLKCAQKKDPKIKGLCYGECPCCKRHYDGDNDNNPATGWGWGPWRSVPNYWRIPQKRRIVPSYSKATGQEILGRTANSNKNSEATTGIVVVEEIEGCPCEKIYKPVCGSDNATYGNQCVFECQQKNDSCLTQACTGECPCCACNKVCDDKPPETGDSKSKYYKLAN